MKIESIISVAVIDAVKTLYGQEISEKMVQLQKTKREFEGNLTLVVFPFLKISKKKPEDTAQEIGLYLKDNPFLPFSQMEEIKISCLLPF